MNEASGEAAALDAIATSNEAAALEVTEAFFPGGSMLAIMNDILAADLAVPSLPPPDPRRR